MKTLKNGATIIETSGNVVLAKKDGYMPFVTWKMDKFGNCYTGHYFNSLDEALEDFNERAAR